ncbi:SGNH hydrolase-type esterase domain-containing protein [Xylariomycetidae sp. FL2044]|nr:SGNH hydrolase-type esterase domain-containing protein [Xylariomycetidae sp. FL2044]
MLAFSKRPPLLERVNRGVAVAAATFAILFIIATTWRLNESWSYSQKIEIPETPSVNDTALSVSSLRIMPMGASTIFGEKNNGDTGWRRDFRDQVVAVGPKVNMVGSARMGDMLDNDCEGHMGNTIESIHEWARAIVPPTQPNLVVLLAGANNIYQLADVDHAHEHLENLIRWILEVSPRATVIMSTLLLSGLPDCVPYYKTVNQRYRELYRRLEEERVPVVLAEVHPESGLPGRPEARDIGPDGAHPTDEGYAKMNRLIMVFPPMGTWKESPELGYQSRRGVILS